MRFEFNVEAIRSITEDINVIVDAESEEAAAEMVYEMVESYPASHERAIRYLIERKTFRDVEINQLDLVGPDVA